MLHYPFLCLVPSKKHFSTEDTTEWSWIEPHTLMSVRMGNNFLVDHVVVLESKFDRSGCYLTISSLAVEVPPASRTAAKPGDIKAFTIEGIPASQELDKVSLTLTSPFAMEGRPIKFAQGFDGEVSLSLPSTPTNSGSRFVLFLVSIYIVHERQLSQASHGSAGSGNSYLPIVMIVGAVAAASRLGYRC